MEELQSNAQRYAPENVKRLPDIGLTGKTICYLGSSVTYGAAAKAFPSWNISQKGMETSIPRKR